MKPEIQRIRIARLQGWKFSPDMERPDVAHSDEYRAEAIMCWVRPGNEWWKPELLPDYLSDLNLMHQVEKGLTLAQFEEYWQHLFIIRNPHEMNRSLVAHSNAEQRAEAYLKTVKEWDKY